MAEVRVIEKVSTARSDLPNVLIREILKYDFVKAVVPIEQYVSADSVAHKEPEPEAEVEGGAATKPKSKEKSKSKDKSGKSKKAPTPAPEAKVATPISDPVEEVDLVVNLPRDIDISVYSRGGSQLLRGAKGQSISVVGLLIDTSPEVLRPYYVDSLLMPGPVSMMATGAGSERYLWDTVFGPGLLRWSRDLEHQLRGMGFSLDPKSADPTHARWLFASSERALQDPMFMGKLRRQLTALLDYLEHITSSRYRWSGFANRWTLEALAYAEAEGNPVIDLDVAEGGATKPKKAPKPAKAKASSTKLTGKMKPKAVPVRSRKNEYAPGFLQLAKFLEVVPFPEDIGARVITDSYFTEDPTGIAIRERLSRLNEWLVHRLNFVQHVTLDMALRVSGLDPYYDKLFALTVGDHSKEMQQRYTQDLVAIEDSLREGHQVLVQRTDNVSQALDANFQEARYRSVYMHKYGWTRYKTVAAKIPFWWPRVSNRSGQTMQEYVRKHNAKEDQVVQAEIELREAWEKLVASGVGAELRSLRNEVYDGYTIRDRWVAWLALKRGLSIEQRSGKAQNDWYRTNDGVPLVCPHVIDLLQLQHEEMTTGKSSPAAEIEAIYRRYQLTELKDRDDTTTKANYGTYYCRICGESMRVTEEMDSYATDDADFTFNPGDERDPLEIEIRNVVFSLAKSCLEFAQPKSQQYWRKMINVITGSLNPLIILVDRKIRKNRTITDEQIQGRVRLFIHVYTYASLMQIVLDHGKEAYLIAPAVNILTKDPRKNAAVIRIGDRLPAMLRFAVGRINAELGEVLRQIPDADDDFINSALVQAYENIRSTTRGTILGDDVQTDAYMLPYDPLLRALGIYCKIDGIKPKTTRVSLVRNPESVATTEASSSASTTSNKPKRKGKKSTARLAKEKIQSRIERKSKPVELVITVIDSEATYHEQKSELLRIVRHFSERVAKMDLPELRAEITSGKLNSEYWGAMIYQALSRTYEFSHEKIGAIRDPTTMEFTKAATTWAEAQQPVQDAITRIWSSTKLWYCKPSVQYPGFPDLDCKYQPLTLARYRDYLRCRVGSRVRTGPKDYTSGKLHTHEFSTYELRWTGPSGNGRKAGETRLMPVKQLRAEPIADLAGWIYVCPRCSVCKYSEQELLDSNENPSEAIDREQESNNMFNYYEIRCPVSDPSPYHEFSREGEKKSRAKVGKGSRPDSDAKLDPPCIKCGLTQAMRGEQDSGYFKKYQKIFQQDSAEDRAAISTELEGIMKTKSKSKTDSAEPKPTLLRTTATSTNDLSKRLEDLIGMGAQNLNRAIQYMGAVELYEYDLVLNGNVKPDLDANRGPRLNIYIATAIRYFVTLQNYKNLAVIPEELKPIIAELPNGTWTKIDGHGKVAKLVPEAGAPYMSWLNSLRAAGTSADDLAEQQHQYLVNMLLGMIKIDGMSRFVQFLVEKLMQDDRLTSKLKDAKAASLDAKHQLYQAKTINEDKFYHMAHEPRPDRKDEMSNPFSFDHMDYDGHNEKYNR